MYQVDDGMVRMAGNHLKIGFGLMKIAIVQFFDRMCK